MVPATANGGENGGRHQSEASAGGGSSSSSGLKRGPWTAEEDAILVDYVKKHGEGNWNAVQRHSGLARCGKSCRLRWANHLRPHLKKGAFSPEEERLIVELHAKFGNKWARMASLLPGRTDNEIKNYWNTRVKRHQRQGLSLYPPDIFPQHHRHNPHLHSNSTTPTTPTSSFTFQTQLSPPSASLSSPPPLALPITHTPPPLSPISSPSTTTTTSSTNFQPLSPLPHHHHHHHSHYLHHLPDSSLHYHSTPTTPTSSFTFQTQCTPPTPPLASPTSTNSNASPILPLFEFSLPSTPPILQTPLRFKRFSSACSSSSANAANTNNDNAVTIAGTSLNTHFSLPLSPTSISNNTTPLGQNIPCCFSNLLNSSSSDFHKELQKENEEMRSLYASVTQQQPELPSIQLLSPTSQNNPNSGINIATTNSTNTTSATNMKNKKFGLGVYKKKNGNGGMGLMRGGSGMLEDLLREAKELATCGESSMQQCNLITAEEDSKPIVFDGFGTGGGNWDPSNSRAWSSELKPNAEEAGQFNTIPQDSTKLLDTLPSNVQVELYSDSGDISNGPSSVVTDDNLGFDMQQIASLFPTSADTDRNLGSCWDNFP